MRRRQIINQGPGYRFTRSKNNALVIHKCRVPAIEIQGLAMNIAGPGSALRDDAGSSGEIPDTTAPVLGLRELYIAGCRMIQNLALVIAWAEVAERTVFAMVSCMDNYGIISQMLSIFSSMLQLSIFLKPKAPSSYIKTMSLVIPTRLREELPEGFAYPLWPGMVTKFLEDTPQREDAELVFHWRDELWESHWRERILRRQTIKLLSAEYTLHWSPYFPKWKINIYSVPKEYFRDAQHILFKGGMIALAERLIEHGVTPDREVREDITMDLSQF